MPKRKSRANHVRIPIKHARRRWHCYRVVRRSYVARHRGGSIGVRHQDIVLKEEVNLIPQVAPLDVLSDCCLRIVIDEVAEPATRVRYAFWERVVRGALS